jgi:hypothetical protein
LRNFGGQSEAAAYQAKRLPIRMTICRPSSTLRCSISCR